jgi:hypothetical protein
VPQAQATLATKGNSLIQNFQIDADAGSYINSVHGLMFRAVFRFGKGVVLQDQMILIKNLKTAVIKNPTYNICIYIYAPNESLQKHIHDCFYNVQTDGFFA